MGNPLHDIPAEVDISVVGKYGLKMDEAILAEDKHQPLIPKFAKLPNVQFTPGGATQNSIRVAQWMLQALGATAYMGCIGKNEFGEKMNSISKNKP